MFFLRQYSLYKKSLLTVTKLSLGSYDTIIFFLKNTTFHYSFLYIYSILPCFQSNFTICPSAIHFYMPTHQRSAKKAASEPFTLNSVFSIEIHPKVVFLFYQQKLAMVYSKSITRATLEWFTTRQKKAGRTRWFSSLDRTKYMYLTPNNFTEEEHSTCARYKGLREKSMCMK